METNVLVLHTTEGRSLPDYSGGSVAPNLTALPDVSKKKISWYQHFDIDRSSRALVNLSGGVETNTLNVVQLELVGTCSPSTHVSWGNAAHIYWPEAPDWALEQVADFMSWLHAEHNVPMTAPSRAKWVAYPDSYGPGGQRMSQSDWLAFKGVCGHEHVPENVHGDPGSLDITRLLAYTKDTSDDTGTGTQTGGQTPIVTLTKVDLSKLAKAARIDPDAKQGHQTYATGTRLVEKALVKLKYLSSKYGSDGSFGSKTVDAYAAYQHHLGYRGSDANGIPGKNSLVQLGKDTKLFSYTA
jgi:hypothetical protein